MEELAAFFIQIFRQGFPCLFKLLTGLYYPGCGVLGRWDGMDGGGCFRKTFS